MNRKILLAALCGVAIAVPALAVGAHEMHKQMSGPISRADVEKMVKEHFTKVDSDGDGYIMKAEADAARAKMTKDMRDEHFKKMDANGDGSISRAEFDAQHSEPMAMSHEKHEEAPAGMAMKHDASHRSGMGMMMRHHGGGMFERADADKDGRVSLAEALAKPLAHFDKVDSNKDGTISPEERKAAHEKMRAERHSNHG